jgi:hypothetical protein
MKRISSNTTGLMPVFKSLFPQRKARRKQKKDKNRSSPGFSRQARKMVQTTTNNSF